MLRRFVLICVGMLLGLVLGAVAVLAWQGQRKPDTFGQFVALGSSYAAGIGLGPREPGSPLVCMRSTNGYPHQLARLTGLRLVDMSCSGSTTEHILHGGQVFLGPQLAAIGPKTRLVTITSGGNDVGYIGGLMFAASGQGPLGKLLRRDPKPLEARDFAKVGDNLVRIVGEVRRRAPAAQVVIVSYPDVLPPEGSCAALVVDPKAADLGRRIAARLHDASRDAADRSGALFVDMGADGAGHDACSAAPWVNGAKPGEGAPFHPNAAGALATAEAVFKALSHRDPKAD